MSRLSIEITSKEYQQIKALAELEGKSIKTLVLERLFDKINVDSNNDEDQAWEDLINFLKHRIAKAETGKESSKTIDQIAEEILYRHNEL